MEDLKAAETGLAAVQLVPAWALLGESMRGTATLTAEEKTLWALAPWRLLEFVAPGFFGGAPGQQVAPVFARLGGAAAAPGGLPTYTLPFVQSVFAGSLLLPLAAAGARAPRIGPVLAAASGLFAWLALGHHLGAAQLLGAVPIWGSFRYAEKLVGPLSLCLALLGGLGLNRLGVRVPTRRALSAAAAAALCAGLVAIAVHSSSGDRPVPHGLGRGLLQTAAVLGLLAALWAVLRLRPGTGRIAPVALSLLVYLDVLAASLFAIHAGERGVDDWRVDG